MFVSPRPDRVTKKAAGQKFFLAKNSEVFFSEKNRVRIRSVPHLLCHLIFGNLGNYPFFNRRVTRKSTSQDRLVACWRLTVALAYCLLCMQSSGHQFTGQNGRQSNFQFMQCMVLSNSGTLIQ